MQRRFTMRIFLYVLITVSIVLLASLLYRQNTEKKPLVYADRTVVSALWSSYKERYWEASTGRTIDKQQNGITTSEGQSYTMLRAAWMADKPTFDKTWEWTKTSLQHDDDNLFAWKWGKRSDGSYGLLTKENGQNAASDADVDIAYALLMAAQRWQQQSYLNEAAKIIPRIWSEEVATINGKPLLMANDLEKGSSAQKIIINPSYIAPYAFRAFAKIDRKHDWLGLVDASYEFLDKATSQPIAGQASVGLPANWLRIDRTSGHISPTGNTDLSIDYGFDAMRTSWRLMLDYQWNQDPRALALLQRPSTLLAQWEHTKKLAATYSYSGRPLIAAENTASYGGNMGYFMALSPRAAQELYTTKLLALFNPTTNQWRKNLSYYDENWAWFGMALYNHLLTDVAGDIK